MTHSNNIESPSTSPSPRWYLYMEFSNKFISRISCVRSHAGITFKEGVDLYVYILRSSCSHVKKITRRAWNKIEEKILVHGLKIDPIETQ